MVQTAAASVRARRPDPSEKVVEKKREILDAASRVFRRQGLHATGMRDIASELGMAVGNLYYYFRDKDELLAFVQEDTLAGLLALAAEVRQAGLPADAQLRRLLEGHVVRLNQETPGSLAHLEVEALGEPWRQAVQARRDEYERVFREILEEGMAAGIFRPADAKVCALALLGAVNWTVKWFRPDGGKSAREIGGECAELLVRGLLAELHLSSPSPVQERGPGSEASKRRPVRHARSLGRARSLQKSHDRRSGVPSEASPPDPLSSGAGEGERNPEKRGARR